MTADDFLSGQSGHVNGVRRTSRAILSDAAADALGLALRRPQRLHRAAQRWPVRRVLALGTVRPEAPELLAAASHELARSRHQVRFASRPVSDRGKFENLNALLEEQPARGHDWLLVIDDDVVLPPHFLDVFVFLAERFHLQLAQPAHYSRSHAAWEVTRRRMASIVRETRLVEIGPVTAFHAATFDVLLPFPELRIGWGLDMHWSALAGQRGWRLGVIDATPIRHATREIAAAYDRELAIREARAFLSQRAYTKADDAARTLAVHRSWR